MKQIPSLLLLIILSVSLQAQPNIILIIGDGMGVSQVTAALLAAEEPLHLQRMPFGGLVLTTSGNSKVTDSAAGATAFSCGEKTYNGAIGVGMDSMPIENLTEYLSAKGYNIGLVASASITHATPAAFYAHNVSRRNYEAIALDLTHSEVDLFLGGGRQYFAARQDSLQLIDSLTSSGFAITNHPADWQELPACTFIADGEPPRVDSGRGDMLAQGTLHALRLLDEAGKPFLLMVEGSQIDWGGHENDYDYIVQELLDMDKAVGIALNYAEQRPATLVLVTADHETGGLSLAAIESYMDMQPRFSTTKHTAAMVPVLSAGWQADKFGGIMDNTSIHDRLIRLIESY